MKRDYAVYAAQKTVELVGIDSPTGYTHDAASWVKNEFEALGYKAELTVKGGVIIDLGGADESDALLLEAHTDTLGGMVAEIKGNGRLRITNLGGLRADNCETENVRVHTREGKVIEGTCQLCNASIHVNGAYNDTKRGWDTMEIVLDEDAASAADARKLGINAPARESGDLEGTPGCKLVGPCGEVVLEKGVIAAKRHIHFNVEEAAAAGVVDKQIVSVKVDCGTGRSLTFGDVVVRVSPSYAGAMHIDTDESNAAGIVGTVDGEIIP